MVTSLEQSRTYFQTDHDDHDDHENPKRCPWTSMRGQLANWIKNNQNGWESQLLVPQTPVWDDGKNYRQCQHCSPRVLWYLLGLFKSKLRLFNAEWHHIFLYHGIETVMALLVFLSPQTTHLSCRNQEWPDWLNIGRSKLKDLKSLHH